MANEGKVRRYLTGGSELAGQVADPFEEDVEAVVGVVGEDR